VSATADLSRYFLPISRRPEITLEGIGLSGRVSTTFVGFDRDLDFFGLKVEISIFSLLTK
jgi:hypothetical protein